MAVNITTDTEHFFFIINCKGTTMSQALDHIGKYILELFLIKQKR